MSGLTVAATCNTLDLMSRVARADKVTGYACVGFVPNSYGGILTLTGSYTGAMLQFSAIFPFGPTKIHASVLQVLTQYVSRRDFRKGCLGVKVRTRGNGYVCFFAEKRLSGIYLSAFSGGSVRQNLDISATGIAHLFGRY